MPTAQPMAAATVEDIGLLRWPLLASPKLDGARAWLREGVLLSRRLEVFPNRQIQKIAAATNSSVGGLDGEIIIGPPHAQDACRRTMAYLSAADAVERPQDIGFWVFDIFTGGNFPFEKRLAIALSRANSQLAWVKPVTHKLLKSPDELLAYEAQQLLIGYEGVMLRHPQAPYKHGRSTFAEHGMLKFTKKETSEARITTVVEAMQNLNEPVINKVGVPKRSTAKAGKVGKGEMGSIDVADIHSGVQFSIGSGFTKADREAIWRDRKRHEREQTIVKYEFKPAGVKDKPRQPVFLGVRENFDIPKK